MNKLLRKIVNIIHSNGWYQQTKLKIKNGAAHQMPMCMVFLVFSICVTGMASQSKRITNEANHFIFGNKIVHFYQLLNNFRRTTGDIDANTPIRCCILCRRQCTKISSLSCRQYTKCSYELWNIYMCHSSSYIWVHQDGACSGGRTHAILC